MNDIEKRVTVLETQVGRIVSDIESEKRTRASANVGLDERLRELEKSNWKAAGAIVVALIVIEVCIKLVPAFIK